MANTRADLPQTIPVLEERLHVARRPVQIERVVLRKTVSEHEEPAELTLRSDALSVERIPVNRVVASPPPIREEGDTLMVPVLEEIMVVETRLVLKEELRVRRSSTSRAEHRSVRLRREEVAVERSNAAPATSEAEENDVSTTQSTNPTRSVPPPPSEGDATRQVVAMFETYEQARAARDKLVGSGISSGQIELLDRNAEPTDATLPYERTSTGFWGAIKRLFVPDEDAHGYAEGLERGHAMLVVRPYAEQCGDVTRILESFDPIDFDRREEEWRGEGWGGVNAGAAMFGAPAGGVAGGAGATVADPATGGRPPPRTGSEAERLVAGSDAVRRTSADGDEVIPVAEERLRIGKRQVAQGAVRVRSYVVETPAEEEVRLRQESVRVERRPVDRPASEVPADAFRERTMEVQAIGEEPVVGKEARVVEEVGLHKDVGERTETVRDTTRRTEVKVEDERENAPARAGRNRR